MAIPRRTTDVRPYVWQGDPAVGGGADMLEADGSHEGADVFCLRPLTNGEGHDVVADAPLSFLADGRPDPAMRGAVIYRHCLAVASIGCVRVVLADGSERTDVRRLLDGEMPRDVVYALSRQLNRMSAPGEAEATFRGARSGALDGAEGASLPAEV